MTAHELVSTMDAARVSWKLVAARNLTRRQLLFIADILRARLLNDRRVRQPSLFENSAQTLPLLTPIADTTNVFGADSKASMVGPIPRPLDAQGGPGFTFVGIPGQTPLQAITPAGIASRKASRHSADRPCYLWDAAGRLLVFNESVGSLVRKRRVSGVFLHPIEVANFTLPGATPVLKANPLDFEYPLPGGLVQILLEMAAQHESITTLLPKDLENDDQANP